MLSEGKFQADQRSDREKGYDGADGTILCLPQGTEAHEEAGTGGMRKDRTEWLISLLYHLWMRFVPSQDQLDRTIEESHHRRVYDAVTGFKGALFGKKEPSLINGQKKRRP